MVAQLVERLRYVPEVRGFVSRWGNWNFSIYLISGRTVALGSTQPLIEMSNRAIFWGKDVRCLGLITLPHSNAGCLEILGARNSCLPLISNNPAPLNLYLWNLILGTFILKKSR